MSARHDFYQDDSRLTISVYRKKVVENELILDVQSDSLKLSINDETILNLEPLYGKVVPEETGTKVFGTKVEIQLKKADVGITWPSLIRSPKDPGSITTTLSNPSFPPGTSSHTQPPPSVQPRKKSKFDSLSLSLEDDEEPAGTSEKDLESFFQKIYGDLSEEGRRAMLKSYTESGGTVLSTDWGDVGGRKVEARPPG